MTEPTAGPLVFKPLEPFHFELLCPHIRYADKVEIELNGLTPEWSLRHGMHAGRAWAVIEGSPSVTATHWPFVLGAGGFTRQGAIWCYWRDLDQAQTRALMRETPDWLRGIRALAGDMHLGNYVWESNHAARRWLRASHCFDIREHETIDIAGKRCIPFSLLSSEELARV